MSTYIEDNKRMEHAVVGGSTSEALGGGAAVVLTILGLSGVVPDFMVSIAAIVLGVALLFQGGFVAAEFRRVLSASESESRLQEAELGSGLGTEVIAGGAAIVLGILALLGLETQILISVSTIVLGTGILLASGMLARLNEVHIAASAPNPAHERLAREAVSASNAVQVLVGLSAIVLGILSLIGIQVMTLNLVAQLAIGASILLSGSAVSGRMLSLFGA